MRQWVGAAVRSCAGAPWWPSGFVHLNQPVNMRIAASSACTYCAAAVLRAVEWIAVILPLGLASRATDLQLLGRRPKRNQSRCFATGLGGSSFPRPLAK